MLLGGIRLVLSTARSAFPEEQQRMEIAELA